MNSGQWFPIGNPIYALKSQLGSSSPSPLTSFLLGLVMKLGALLILSDGFSLAKAMFRRESPSLVFYF